MNVKTQPDYRDLFKWIYAAAITRQPIHGLQACGNSKESAMRSILWFVAEIGRQPAFEGGEVHALAARIILDLILAEVSHGKVSRFGM